MSKLTKNDEFWYQWLVKYKSFIGLWNKQSKLSMCKSYQRRAWSELIVIAQKVYAEADLNFLRTRLHGFAYKYKLEAKKVEIAMANGINYVPSSYCYKIFKSIYENQESSLEQLPSKTDLVDRKYQNFWRKVLEYYISYKCLWDFENKNLYTKELRKRAWQNLTQFVRSVHPKADEYYVKTRIQSYRTVFRRERRKVISAKQGGFEYKPKVFYYDILEQAYKKDCIIKDSRMEIEDLKYSDDITEQSCIKNETNVKFKRKNKISAPIMDKQLWRNVLKKYVSLKCLWDFQNKKFYQKKECNEAWQELLKVAKKIRTDFDLDHLRKRIHSSLTTYRKELKKIALAKERGVELKSRFFYFDILCALNREDSSTMMFSSDELTEEMPLEELRKKSEQKEYLQAVEEELKQKGLIYAPLFKTATDYNNKIWLQVIKKFVFCKCLWDYKNKNQYDSYEREYAWQQLVHIAKKINDAVDLAYVKRRLSNFRCAYRRELKNAQHSQSQGSVYEISLFYFNALSPIYQKGFPIINDGSDDAITTEEYTLNPANSTYYPEDRDEDENHTNLNTDKFINTKEDDFSFIEVEMQKKPTFNSFEHYEIPLNNTSKLENDLMIRHETFIPKMEKINKKTEYQEDIEEQKITPVQGYKRLKRCDNFETIADGISEHLESMESDQCLLAEKLILDVCITGRLNKLTKQSRILLKKS